MECDVVEEPWDWDFCENPLSVAFGSSLWLNLSRLKRFNSFYIASLGG